MNYIYIFLTLFLLNGQDTQQAEKQAKAIEFVHLLKETIDSNRIDSFLPQLVVNRAELHLYLDEESRRKYGKRGYKKILKEFGHPFKQMWEAIQKDDEYAIAAPFIRNKNMVTDEKEFKATFVNALFSDIQVATSDKYDRHYGEMSKLRIYLISANMLTQTNPIYEYKVTFPCIWTMEGRFKLVASSKGEFISMQQPKE